jgi:hypothetical protein
MTRGWCLALALAGCNQGALPGPIEAPRPTQLCTATGRTPVQVVAAARAEIPSLAVIGDDLFFADVDRFIPMDYVTEGAVMRAPRCGGGATAASEVHDGPSYLVANGPLLHWIADQHNAFGENLGAQVWTRDGGQVRKAASARNVDIYRINLSSGAVFVLATVPQASGTMIHRLSDDFSSLASFRDSGFLLPGDRLVLLERDQVSSLDAQSGQITALWQQPGMKNAQVFGDHVFYVDQKMLVKRALTVGALEEKLFAVEGELRGLKAGGDQVFFVDQQGIHRGAELLVPRAGDWPHFMPLALDGDRLYFVAGARVLAIDRR